MKRNLQLTEKLSASKETKRSFSTCIVQVLGSNHLSICAVYRPPSANEHNYLEKLNECLLRIPNTNHLWVAGDFNLGEIDWVTSSPVANCHHPNIAKQLIDIANDNSLTQMVDKPTRLTDTASSTLDLFFTNCPNMVNWCEVIPGISDHDIPLLDVSTRITLNKTTPRIVCQYHNADFDVIDHPYRFDENIHGMWIRCGLSSRLQSLEL